jgi:signal transduction histidine kinase
VRSDLHDLLRINLKFVDVAQAHIDADAARMRAVLVSIGLVGIVLAGALAWQVRRAIAPRIAGLVAKVKSFQESGVHERSLVEGRDEIAVLENALDVGFAAIAERDRERERFYAVAAHELKTPMVSILGFSEAALANPDDYRRALEVIRRQSRRLARLVEDLLWAATVRAGQLPFLPTPLNLTEVAGRVAREVEDEVPSHPIVVHGSPGVRLLADESLLSHVLWSLLTLAGAFSTADERIDLDVERADTRAQLRVEIHGPPLSPEDESTMFAPFSTIQYEEGSRPRSPMGLFLCREIARMHGGSLLVKQRAGAGPILLLDLPA